MDEFNPSPEFEEKVRAAMEVPSANPEFVKRLRNDLARRPVKVKAKFTLKPAWAFAFVLALLTLSGAAYALGRAFGYIPGVGLVENASGMRVLAEPASVTRDGVTLTVTQALVYPDYVQLIYEASGIAPENDGNFAEDSATNLSAFCGSPDGDAKLRLPDGTMINRAFDMDKYPENVFAMKPAFEAVIPADVTELTMALKCIPWARLGAAPEDWEVPFKLKDVPAGTVIGEPVLEVTPSVASSVHDNGLTVTLDKVVPQDDLYSFYFTIVPDQPNDAVLAYYPMSAYMIDATGQRIALVYMHPFPGSQDVSEPWELQSVSKPAYGPYTLVIERVAIYYNEDGSHYFEFDLGANPQVGQTWEINQTLDLAGTDVRVLSATMAEEDLSMWGGSPNTPGLVFTFEAVDGKTPFSLDIMDRDIDHIMNGIYPMNESLGDSWGSNALGLFYEKGIPTGKLAVAVNGQTTTLTGNWQVQWTSPDQAGSDLLEQTITSQPGISGVTAELHSVVKTNDGYLFFVHLNMPGQNPDLRVVSPLNVCVIDSTGKKIELALDGPQAYLASDQTLWQFRTAEQIASGPLKVVIENAEASYTAWDWSVPPSAETVAAHSFTFDAGADPQPGQTWPLDTAFEIGGYQGKVTSVKAVTVDPQNLSFPELRSDVSINSGYEFTIQALDPSVQWKVMVSLGRPEGSQDFVDCIGYLPGAAGNTAMHTATCRGLPTSILQVTIDEISILLNGVWEMDWNLPAQ